MSEKPIYIITFDSANNSMLLYRLLIHDGQHQRHTRV